LAQIFLFKELDSILKRIHGSSSLAAFALVGPFFIVFIHIRIQINLQGLQIRIEPLSEGNLVKFIENGLVNPLADSIRLGTSDFRLGMVDVIELQEQFVRMLIGSPTVLSSSIR
jgi:hypothetical protein